MHECDFLLLTKNRYLWEIEIKVSKADLIADKKKIHGHINSNVKRLYFALPHYMEDYIQYPGSGGCYPGEQTQDPAFLYDCSAGKERKRIPTLG
jgi:hypothetical protein